MAKRLGLRSESLIGGLTVSRGRLRTPRVAWVIPQIHAEPRRDVYPFAEAFREQIIHGQLGAHLVKKTRIPVSLELDATPGWFRAAAMFAGGEGCVCLDINRQA